MRLLLLSLLLPVAFAGKAQTPTLTQVKAWEETLSEVTEITDTSLLKKLLPLTEAAYQDHPNETTQARLGILYHEVALNLGFLAKTTFKGYAQKSFDLLTPLSMAANTAPGLRPFVDSYRASALSLVSGETRRLSLVGDAFTLFADAVEKWSSVCWAPLFLRGSVAENLPFLFWRKKRIAAGDFSKMISLYESNPEWAPANVMSFTYWAWAAQHPQKKYRRQAITYLERAIFLDPNGTAGKNRAEKLLAQWR